MSINTSLRNLCQSLENDFAKIPEPRQAELGQLADYFQKKIDKHQTPKIVVICTHNSRRSHLGQLWLATAVDYYQLSKVETYSGGTEATAFNPRAVAALQRLGFDITTGDAAAENPIYHIKWSDAMTPYSAFSKKYESDANPQQDFAAVMVCSSADEDCPVVFGADFRLALPYDDPKQFDGTEWEVAKYDERALQIGREMLYAMSRIK